MQVQGRLLSQSYWDEIQTKDGRPDGEMTEGNQLLRFCQS